MSPLSSRVVFDVAFSQQPAASSQQPEGRSQKLVAHLANGQPEAAFLRYNPAMAPAKTPIGVILSAVLALLGSLLVLGMCSLVVLTFFLGPARPLAPELRLAAMVGFAIFALFGAWGVATAIGLFRLRNWGRISILVFGVLLVLMALVSVPTVFIIPAPPTAPGNYGAVMKVIAAFYAACGLLGACWIYYFGRRVTREVFGGAGTAGSGGRPLSISIIGWWFLLAGVISVLLSPLRMPSTLLVWVLTGWIATAYRVIFGALWIYCGSGLLRLNAMARLLTIALLCFGLVNAAVFFGVPGREQRIATLMSHWIWQTQPLSPTFPMRFAMMVAPLTVAVPLWFLIRTKDRFQPAPPTAG